MYKAAGSEIYMLHTCTCSTYTDQDKMYYLCLSLVTFCVVQEAVGKILLRLKMLALNELFNMRKTHA